MRMNSMSLVRWSTDPLLIHSRWVFLLAAHALILSNPNDANCRLSVEIFLGVSEA